MTSIDNKKPGRRIYDKNKAKSKNHIPRLSIKLEQNAFNNLARLIPFGAKNALFRIIVDDLISKLDSRKGPEFLGYMLNRDMNLITSIGRDIDNSTKCSLCREKIEKGEKFSGMVNSLDKTIIRCKKCDDLELKTYMIARQDKEFKDSE